jgi:His/Glu/Gln/Arg/opine family amino acid ABC transporter permease subunit
MTWDWNFIFEHVPYLLEGLKYTFIVALSTMAIGMVLGLAIAVARTAGPRWVALPCAAFTDLFRGTPILTQLLFFYITVPLTLDVVWSPLTTAIISFSLNVAAYCAETFRAGIRSISASQFEGALALGMSRPLVYRRVILPLSIRRVIPALGNIWVSIFKDSSLVALVSVPDVLFRGRELANIYYRPLELFSAVAVIYFLVSIPQAKAVDWLYSRYRTEA